MHRPPPARAYERRRDHIDNETRHTTNPQDTGNTTATQQYFHKKVRKRSDEPCATTATHHTSRHPRAPPKTTRDQAQTHLLRGTIRNNARDKSTDPRLPHTTQQTHTSALTVFTETDHGQRTHVYLPAPHLLTCTQTVNTTTSMSTNDVNGRCGKRPDYQSRTHQTPHVQARDSTRDHDTPCTTGYGTPRAPTDSVNIHTSAIRHVNMQTTSRTRAHTKPRS